MKILATTGDVKTGPSEDASRISVIFFYLFGLKKVHFMGSNEMPLFRNFMAFVPLLSRTIFKARKSI